jgi:hypothetical protein
LTDCTKAGKLVIMELLIPEFIEACAAAYEHGGLFALLAPVLLFGIRFVRLDQVQGRLPAWARWSSWPRWGRWLALFLTAVLAAVVTAVVGGAPVAAAVVAAIPVGLTAMGGHKLTKAAGKKWVPPRPDSRRSLVADIATGKLRVGVERSEDGSMLINPYSS